MYANRYNIKAESIDMKPGLPDIWLMLLHLISLEYTEHFKISI